MNAREDARRDAREDAPGARHLSYLARPGARGSGTHVAVRHDVGIGRRVRGLRARDEPARAGCARRGSRAAAGERRPHGGERQVRERRRSHRERSAARARGPARPQPRKSESGKPSRAFRRRIRRKTETGKKNASRIPMRKQSQGGVPSNRGDEAEVEPRWRQTRSAFSRFAPRGAKKLSGPPRAFNSPRALRPVGGVAKRTYTSRASPSTPPHPPSPASRARPPLSSRRAARSSRRASLFNREKHRDVREPRFHGSRRAGELRRRRQGARRAQGRLQ
jgi:hypothetical protein